jgi:hypothetical protein
MSQGVVRRHDERPEELIPVSEREQGERAERRFAVGKDEARSPNSLHPSNLAASMRESGRL